MKLEAPKEVVLQAALAGDLVAIDSMLKTLQPGVFNLAVCMLGQREDAADATQEILLKVITHLASFRRDASFTTWVFQIARNHLLTAVTRAKENPELSLDALRQKLAQGLDFGDQIMAEHGEHSISPEDKAMSRQIAIGCTQSMLMALDREHRLAYVLDTIFGLSTEEGAVVLGIRGPAYRKRLSRARASLDQFTSQTCGLANRENACHCVRQVTAVKFVRSQTKGEQSVPFSVSGSHELQEAERQFDSLLRMSDSAALFRAHPEYQIEASRVEAIRAVLKREGHWPNGKPITRH